MLIRYHSQFRKHYKKRIAPYPDLKQKFAQRVELFLDNSKHPLLKDHSLVGQKKMLRAFWVTGDVRVVYKIEEQILYLYDIGTHNQVY
jgi:addiction module RelE/StbE family toxin